MDRGVYDQLAAWYPEEPSVNAKHAFLAQPGAGYAILYRFSAVAKVS